MLGMSQEQWLGQLRILLPALGMLAVASGFMSQTLADLWVSKLLIISGPLMIVVGSVWSAIDKTRASLVAKVDAMAKDPTSPVAGVIMTNTPDGRALAAGLPGNTTVVAGSPDAANIVRNAA